MSPQLPIGTRTRRLLRAVGTLSCCLGCLLGCTAETGDRVRLEVDSWWKRQSERDAFASVLGIYNRAHPEVEAINQASETDADAVRATLSTRLLAGAPPSSFQANAGADLLRWTAVDTNDPGAPSASHIMELSGLFRSTGLLEALPTPLYDSVLAGPERLPYGVPLNIHRLNLIYYRKEAVGEFSEATGGQSFLTPGVLCPDDVASKLSQLDAKLPLKIAVGTMDGFALTLFTLESVLPAVAGPDLYEALFHGKAAGDWQTPVRHALECVQYMSRSFLDDRGKNWADALAQVQAREAAFSVMGDWSNGELRGALERGEVEVQPFPGSEDSFVFTSDTFPLPVSAPHLRESQSFLETLASVGAQLAFSEEKGSIPARGDIDLTSLGPAALLTQKAFNDEHTKKLLATSGLFPPYFPDAELTARLSRMTKPGAGGDEIDDVIALLEDTQPLFVRWHARVDEGQSDPQ